MNETPETLEAALDFADAENEADAELRGHVRTCLAVWRSDRARLLEVEQRLTGLQQDVLAIVAMYQTTGGMHPKVRQALEESCARSTAPAPLLAGEE